MYMKQCKLMKRMIRTHVLRKNVKSLLTFGLLVISLLTFGQNAEKDLAKELKVEGIVRDAISKEPIEAAQISTFNSKAAATTDKDGKFEIELSIKNDVLVISAYDYNTREIVIKGQKDLEIDLYSDKYTSWYGSIEGLTGTDKETFSTKASNKIDEIGQLGYATIDEQIQMKLGGDVRSMSRSGVSGLGSSFFIRGLNSIKSNSQPLFVIDGVVWNNFYDVTSLHEGYFNNSLMDIDPYDVENITVIKDGTSIYGSKGANGVIVINTLRAKDQATKITFNALAGVTNSTSSLPTMDGDQFRIYASDLIGAQYPNIDLGNYYFLQDDPTALQYKKYHNNTNWDETVYQQSNTQSYSIGVSGGDDKALYYFSAGYYGNTGIVKSTSLDRLNTRFNADFSMTDFLSMGLDIGFTNVDRVLLDDGVNFYTSPTYLAMIKAPFLNPYIYTSAGSLTTDFEDSDMFNVGNPAAIINNALNTSKHNRLNIGIEPVWQITPKIKLGTQIDYSLDKVKETYYSPIVGVALRFIPGFGVSENEFRSQQMRNISIFNDSRLTYSNVFKGVHSVNAILGWRYITNYYESDYAEGHNSGTDQKRNLLSEEEYKTSYGINDHVNSISNYLNVDYNYKSRYFLSLAMALDGSSRFGSETKGGMQLFGHSWGLFPSLNGAWLASSERFMSGIDFVDQLKVRASAGLTGNDDIAPYGWATYFTSVKYIDRANGIVLGNIGNNEIQWETTAKMNFGADATLFNDHLSVSADIYSHKTSNLLTLKTLPDIAGKGMYWANGGELSNKGYELSISAKLVNTKAFKWELGASVGHYKNEIISLPGGDFSTMMFDAEILTAVGNAAGVFYGYKTNGVIATEAEALAANLKIENEDGTSYAFSAGDILFEDYHQDGIIDDLDKQIIGDPNPDLYGSFNSKMVLGNFKLNALFTYSYGNDVYNYLRAQLESGTDLSNQSTAMLNRWTYEGQQTLQPQASIDDLMGNSRFSDRWIEDGSYLKLKTLSLSYDLKLKTQAINGLTISVSANNLFTLTNYLGRDPEISPLNSVLSQGIDTGLIPACKSYFIGIKINL